MSDAMDRGIDRPLRAYLAVMAALTADTVAELRHLVSDDVRYSDPFNELRGADAFLRVSHRMFEDCIEPRFTMLDAATAGPTAYVRWRMTFRPRRRPGSAPWAIEGVSEIRFAADGRVTAHIDHWDAASQVYARVPLLGWVLRRLRRRLSVE